ncbi:hypothetical protein EDD37DRAFT_697961 [Exophiala viscosa]|uniref:uncharacterized protein n=1 Tax=Exophiala viscosa TaxID=2486360 RepID=UPI00218CCC58|nr:hypothetical protein EDD37DRAFT_697961 [Exophiala viscosa]
MGKQSNLYSFPTVDDVAAHLRTYILSYQKAAFQCHDAFKVAVSGGSLLATLAKALLVAGANEDPSSSPQFSKWEIFFADERAVPLDHEDSDYGLLKQDLLDKIP